MCGCDAMASDTEVTSHPVVTEGGDLRILQELSNSHLTDLGLL
jgi:hypothetical protein